MEKIDVIYFSLVTINYFRIWRYCSYKYLCQSVCHCWSNDRPNIFGYFYWPFGRGV